MKLHCFHGFLGNPSEFDFLRNDFDVLAYDMSALCSASKEEAQAKLEIAQEDVLVGYSFGARFALEVFEKFRARRLVMLAGHAGLSEEDRSERLRIEEDFVAKVEELSFEQFVEWWNQLNLFANDEPIFPKEVSRETMVNMFREFGLSKQKHCVEFLKRNSNRVLWVCGTKDKKYYDYTRSVVEPLGVKCIYVDSGHRLLQRRETILRILRNYLEKL